MPITCKLLPLSDLFLFHPNTTFDFKGATTQFLAALDNYCAVNVCKPPIPDKPKPAPATVTTTKTQNFGGGGGGPFEWSKVHPTLNARKVLIKSGS